jgi:hypothetical protein
MWHNKKYYRIPCSLSCFARLTSSLAVTPFKFARMVFETDTILIARSINCSRYLIVVIISSSVTSSGSIITSSVSCPFSFVKTVTHSYVYRHSNWVLYLFYFPTTNYYTCIFIYISERRLRRFVIHTRQRSPQTLEFGGKTLTESL